ncbi:unnamed protein product [Urochloa decumbens]|uniref:NB-ARC domain-containing protein n=1 Tax=Urochloa decumbens TaxID=240449 RepID=A0ABC9F1S7_9POAL
MIIELLGDDSLKRLEVDRKATHVEHLASHLRDKLKERRYFIVLDDMWSIDAWEWISDIAFPSNNNKGSRIIVTTRDIGLAKQCTTDSFIYHLECLHIYDATELLLRKTNKRHEEIRNDENLQKIAKRLVEKCGRLPLAILAIGGILASKKIEDWGNFYKELPSELESNPSLEALRKMVILSYNYLPSHLKPCFLYLSIFPEDFEIERRRLVDRWIAEGFVRARAGMTINDIGKSYFNDLMNRSMILPSRKVRIEGMVKSCRVHDVMRDIMVSISREENFVDQLQGNGRNVAEENVRHVAYHGSKWPKSGMDWAHVRSLSFFVEERMERPLGCLPKLRMLRVLDLMDANFRITQKDMNNIGLLCHLRYLNVNTVSSIIHTLPKSIGKMQGLQTLDMGECYITTLPTDITKLQSLRTIRCTNSMSNRGTFRVFLHGPKRCLVGMLCLPLVVFSTLASSDDCAEATAKLHMGCSRCWSDNSGVRVPRGISSLTELQILEVVDISRTCCKAIQEIGKLSQLRRLAVGTEWTTEKKCKILCASIEKVSSIRSLAVRAGEHHDRGLGWLVSSYCPPPNLRNLKLYGYIGDVTDWFRNLTQLVKVCLYESKLKEDKIKVILGALPKLMLLQIGFRAYLGERLVFGTGEFLNLRELKILYMDDLREMRFEEGTSPYMEMVEIKGCKLAFGIIGIKHLPRLKKISLSACGVGRLGILEEEVNAHPNHPILQLMMTWGDAWDVLTT